MSCNSWKWTTLLSKHVQVLHKSRKTDIVPLSLISWPVRYDILRPYNSTKVNSPPAVRTAKISISVMSQIRTVQRKHKASWGKICIFNKKIKNISFARFARAFPFLCISLAFFSRIHDIKWIVLQLCGQSEHLMANFSVVFSIPKAFLPGFHFGTFSALFLYQTTWNNSEMTAETWSYIFRWMWINIFVNNK